MFRPVTLIDAFGVLFDNLIPGQSVDRVWRGIVLNALLYDRMIISDSWLMTNEPLQGILRLPEGRLLLRESILVGARRDTAPSFAEFLAVSQGKMHGITASPEFAQMLDLEAGPHALTFPAAQIGANYKKMAGRVLAPDFLMMLGVSEESAAIVDRLLRANASSDTNTYVKEIVCPALPVAEQNLVMDIARAPYSINLPDLLGCSMICHPEFRGDQVLAALRQSPSHAIGSVEVSSPANLLLGQFVRQVDDPRIGWLLSEGIGWLSAENICVFRSSTLRDAYLEALKTFFASPSEAAWGMLFEALTAYLSDGLDLVVKGGSRASTKISEADAIIKADSALHVIAAGQDTEIKRIPSAAEPVAGDMLKSVSLVGRTWQVPDLPLQ